MARVCATCGKSYPDTTTFCTDDGNPLVPSAQAFAATVLPDTADTRQGGLTAQGAGSMPIVLPGPRTADGGPVTAPHAFGHTGTPTQGGVAYAEPQLVELGPGTLVGEYVVEQQIGEGGMGVIFSARHPVIGKRVAIKVLNPDLAANAAIVQRFVQEARSVNQIGHRNIVDIFSFGRLPDGRHYFVMEFLEGAPFSKRILEPIDWTEAAQIWLQMCAAVEAAHQHGIVHRDLKPDNIFVTPGPEGAFVKVLDFGIAKLMSSETGGVQKTSTGVPMGTPLYMSPEQTRGAGVDHRTDIYAVGCILYETITGWPPFSAPTFFEVMSKQLTEPPPPFGESAEVDVALETLVFQCLEKEPDARPQTMAEVRDRLIALRDAALRADQPLFVRAGHLAPRSERTGPDAATQQENATERAGLSGTRAREVRRRAALDASNTVPEPRDLDESQSVPRLPSAAPAPAARRGGLSLALGGAALFIAVGAVAVVVTRKPAPPPTPVVNTPPPPAPTPATPEEGRIKVISTESGVTLFVDGEKAGEGGPVLVVSAKPGRHEVKVTRPGFLPFSNQVIVAAGETTDEVVKLQPEQAMKAPAPHKPREKRDPGPAAPSAPSGPRDKDSTINPFGQ